jgi:hypothetical protein
MFAAIARGAKVLNAVTQLQQDCKDRSIGELNGYQYVQRDNEKLFTLSSMYLHYHSINNETGIEICTYRQYKGPSMFKIPCKLYINGGHVNHKYNTRSKTKKKQ